MVWPLPVGDLLFVGRAARRTLSQFGVETIGQLAACKPELLEQLMGKAGLQPIPLRQWAGRRPRPPPA